MKKKPKWLIILLAILFCVIIYWLYDRQKGSYRMPKTPQVSVKSIEMPLTPPVAIPAAEPPSMLEVKVERAWGRDPFQPPDGVGLVKKTRDKEQEKEEPLPKVTCIFIKGSQKIATINDKNCCEGDAVGKEKLVEILPDRVILEKGRAKRESLLGHESMSVVKKVK